MEGECLKFNRVENKYGHEKLIKREEIFTEENDFLDDDRLTIVCKLIVQQESVYFFFCYFIDKNHNKRLKEFQDFEHWGHSSY